MDDPKWMDDQTFGHVLLLGPDSNYLAIRSETGFAIPDRISIAAHVRLDDLPKGDTVAPILANGHTGRENYRLSIDNEGHVVFQFNTKDTDETLQWNSVSSRTAVALGRYTDIVVTYDSKKVSIYIDGNLNVSVPPGYSGAMETTSDDLKIGKLHDNVSFFTGVIADLRLYHGVLTPQEVLAGYQSVAIK